MNEIPEAEKASVTKATVVAGLGYPNGRDEVSPEPTGWIVGDVSRETKRIFAIEGFLKRLLMKLFRR